MEHRIAVLWQLHDLTRRVADALLEGLKKPPKADPNKFSLEAIGWMRELYTLIHHTFDLSPPGLNPAEYQQVIEGLGQAVGLRDRVIGYMSRDALSHMDQFSEDLLALAESKRNHHDGIRRIFRICQALKGECRMVCVVPDEEIVLNEVDIGAEIHVG